MNTNPSNHTSNPEKKIPVTPPHHQTLFSRITANLPQKLIALVCSLILFIVVLSDRNMSASFEKLPVQITLPDGYDTIEQIDDITVDVTLQGRASLLRDITRDAIGAITLTPPAREGNVQMTLHSDMLSLPEGVHIEKFYPEFIGVNLEPVEKRNVPISTDHIFTGELQPGYQLGEIRMNPEEIEIYGPKSVISDTSRLYIETIDLTGKSATFNVNRWVVLNRAGLHASTQNVEVTVNIVSKSKTQVLLGVPVVPLNLSQKFELVPPTIDLTLTGDDASLAKIDASRLFITFDASDDNTSQAHTRVLNNADFSVSNLPSGVSFDDTKLPSVMLKVSADSNDSIE
jgi:YbbR domain-containing protein